MFSLHIGFQIPISDVSVVVMKPRDKYKFHEDVTLTEVACYHTHFRILYQMALLLLPPHMFALLPYCCYRL
jgi:hypothetical protein